MTDTKLVKALKAHLERLTRLLKEADEKQIKAENPTAHALWRGKVLVLTFEIDELKKIIGEK